MIERIIPIETVAPSIIISSKITGPVIYNELYFGTNFDASAPLAKPIWVRVRAKKMKKSWILKKWILWTEFKLPNKIHHQVFWNIKQ